MVLSGLRGSGGAREGGGPFTAQNEKGSDDSSKTEGTPQGAGHFGSFLEPQMWHIQVVFTILSRDPRWGSKRDVFGVLPLWFTTR